jgi:hypothetical protein
MSISQEKAIEVLQKLIDEIDILKKDRAFSESHTRWLTNALAIADELFGKQSTIYLSMAALPWKRTGSFILDPMIHGTTDINKISEKYHHEAYLMQLDTAKGFLKAGIDQINLYGIDEVYKSKDTAKESSEIIKILDLIETKLRKTIRAVPRDEKEVQEKFEGLLIARDISYLREQEKIVYSSKTYHPDFCFKKIDTILEIKLCNSPDREKTIISEINDDIIAYQSKYTNIIFLVYDTGHIRDQDKFKEDFESKGNVTVKVVKH